MEINDMVAKINEALVAGGYRSDEAKAVAWKKEVKPGQTIERIYLKGKKANGYVHQVAGSWHAEDISFLALHGLVSNAIA